MATIFQRQIRVLHVDDDPSITDLTKTFLEREDERLTVETATSADEGLERISDSLPDCIVSDYNMPGVGGIEFLQAVREEYPDLPFILFTGEGSETVASDAIAAGVTDYLQKGSGTERYELLANRIRNAVRARREADRAERQEQLMRLTEFAGGTGGFELDRENNTILLTAGTRQIIGRPDTFEITLQGALELFHPDDREGIQQTLDRAFETGEELRDRWRLQPDDGDERLLDITITPVVENGEVTKLRGSGHDITDRTERQRKLTQIETLFQHGQDSLFLVSVDDEYVIERVNPAYEDATGVSASEICGQTPTQLLGEEQGTIVEARYNKCVNRREPLEYTEQLQFGSEPNYWETRIAPVVVEGTVQYIAGSTRDITDRERRKTELQEYETIVEALSDPVYVLDEEGRFTYVNDKFVELVSYDRETILGDTPSLIKDEDAVNRAEQELGRLLSSDGPESVTFEVTVHPRDGDPVVCNDHMGILPYEGESFEGSVGVLREITERKERENMLQKYQNAYESSLSGIAIADLDGELIDVNPAFLDMWGYDSKDDAIGRPAIDMWKHPEKARSVLETVKEQGRQQDELEAVRADGSTFYARGVNSHLTDTEGNPIGVIASFFDITERKEREAELERKREFLEQTQNVAHVGGWELDVRTESLRWTDEVYQIHGVDTDFEPTVEDAIRFYHPEDKTRIQDAVERVTTEGEPFDLEARIVTADDEVRWVSSRGEPRYEDGEIVGVRGTFQDITERIEREQKLEEFASVVSHDLRNPLNVATARLGLAAEECDSAHLDDVEGALNRMETLIDDLLMVAREEKEVTDSQLVDLATTVNGCWENVETNRARLITNTDRGVWADESRLKQVFENLFRNAVEHGGAGVTVTVGGLEDGFYIEDDGPGIPSDERDAVFEDGYSQSTEGTGFGLSIVEQIVNAHDWQIRVTDGTDGGARFEITNVEFVAAQTSASSEDQVEDN